MCLVLRRILITVFAALFLAGPAGAGTIIVKLTFMPGKLVVKAAPATVTGTEQVPVTIADGRGNGSGWTLKVNSASPVRVVGITARCAANSTCTLPTTTTTPTGNVILKASRDSGTLKVSLIH